MVIKRLKVVGSEKWRVEYSKVEWSTVKWSGVEWSRVEWSGVEWSEVKWRSLVECRYYHRLTVAKFV
jgi:hypothetical protein